MSVSERKLDVALPPDLNQCIDGQLEAGTRQSSKSKLMDFVAKAHETTAVALAGLGAIGTRVVEGWTGE